MKFQWSSFWKIMIKVCVRTVIDDYLYFQDFTIRCLWLGPIFLDPEKESGILCDNFYPKWVNLSKILEPYLIKILQTVSIITQNIRSCVRCRNPQTYHIWFNCKDSVWNKLLLMWQQSPWFQPFSQARSSFHVGRCHVSWWLQEYDRTHHFFPGIHQLGSGGITGLGHEEHQTWCCVRWSYGSHRKPQVHWISFFIRSYISGIYISL